MPYCSPSWATSVASQVGLVVNVVKSVKDAGLLFAVLTGAGLEPDSSNRSPQANEHLPQNIMCQADFQDGRADDQNPARIVCLR